MFNRTNLAESRLAAGISSSALAFSVTTGEGQYFPASNFLIGCYPADYVSPAAAKKAGKHEWMIVGLRTVDALSSITRAALGSTALDFNESGKQYVVYNPVVAEELLGFNRLFADAGGDDDYVVSTGFALASLTAFDELVIQLKVATPNTSTPTLAFDSVAAKTIKTMTATGLINAPNYSMIAGGRYFLQWSQADDCWVLLNPSTPAKLTGNVLPAFDAAVHTPGTEYLLIPESVADEAARLVTGTPLRYVYQVDTGITYKCTSEDGDEANDWTAVGTGLLSAKYTSNGLAWIIQDEPNQYCADTGTANAKVLTNLKIANVAVGQKIRWKNLAANTGAVTITLNGVTNDLKKNFNSDLVFEDLQTARFYEAVWNGSNWQLINPDVVKYTVTWTLAQAYVALKGGHTIVAIVIDDTGGTDTAYAFPKNTRVTLPADDLYYFELSVTTLTLKRATGAATIIDFDEIPMSDLDTAKIYISLEF
jgi:hypothetical protein